MKSLARVTKRVYSSLSALTLFKEGIKFMKFTNIIVILSVSSFFIASCSKKIDKIELNSATHSVEINQAPEAADDISSDSNDEKKEENGDDCKNTFEINDLDVFGKEHGIHEQLSKAKWADLEPKLPVSVLKVAPDKDVRKQLESTFNLNCSDEHAPKFASDGASAEIVFCSKKDDEKVEDGFYYYDDGMDNMSCTMKGADYAYLSLVSPKDHFTRVYEIGTNLDFGYVAHPCMNTEHDRSLSFVQIESRPFLDTTGLFVRVVWQESDGVEHSNFGYHNYVWTYTTWLFAGDKHRLVAHWEDCHYSESDEYNNDDMVEE